MHSSYMMIYTAKTYLHIRQIFTYLVKVHLLDESSRMRRMSIYSKKPCLFILRNAIYLAKDLIFTNVYLFSKNSYMR